jgi:hypothetical protein
MIDVLIGQYLLFNEYNENNIDYILNHNYMIYGKMEMIEFVDFNEHNETPLEMITWMYDDNNYKIPIFNFKQLNYIKMDTTMNMYDYISSNSLLPDDEIICGENIQNLCDVVIGDNQTLIQNPNNFKYSKKMQCINSHLNDKNVFVFTHNLIEFYEKHNVSYKKIVSHNSDHPIDNEYLKYLNESKYSQFVQFSQNCLIKHPRLTALPIGIENRQHVDHSMIHSIRKRKDIKKEKYIYFFFSLGTHPTRMNCYNSLKDKIVSNSNKSKEEYFIELKKHKFAICPRGNGLDTHRLWECFYLDVIPIMIQSDFVNIDNLPIIILNSWDDFNEDRLYKEFTNIKNSKVCMSYYKNLIQDR